MKIPAIVLGLILGLILGAMFTGWLIMLFCGIFHLGLGYWPAVNDGFVFNSIFCLAAWGKAVSSS